MPEPDHLRRAREERARERRAAGRPRKSALMIEPGATVYVNRLGNASTRRPSFIDPVKYAWETTHPGIAFPAVIGGTCVGGGWQAGRPAAWQGYGAGSL